jgi:hypothetical protein
MLFFHNLLHRWQEWRDWWSEQRGDIINLAAKKREVWLENHINRTTEF